MTTSITHTKNVWSGGTTDFKTIDFFCGVGGLFLHANVKNLFGSVINLLHV